MRRFDHKQAVAFGHRQPPSESVFTTSRPFDTITPAMPRLVRLRLPLPSRSSNTEPLAICSGAPCAGPVVSVKADALAAAMTCRRVSPARRVAPHCMLASFVRFRSALESPITLGAPHDRHLTARCRCRDTTLRGGLMQGVAVDRKRCPGWAPALL